MEYLQRVFEEWFLDEVCFFSFSSIVIMNLNEGWQEVDQVLRLNYWKAHRKVWLATRAFELRQNHLNSHDIEFRLNGKKLTPTGDFIHHALGFWKKFIVDSMQCIDVQGLIVGIKMMLDNGMEVVKVVEPETYKLFARYNVVTESVEYQATRVLPGGMLASGGHDVTGIEPIAWKIGQSRPEYCQDFPKPGERDNALFIWGGFGFDPLADGTMISRVSRYYEQWAEYEQYKALHMAYISRQVNPVYYAKMAAIPEHVVSRSLFEDNAVRLGDLGQVDPKVADKEHAERTRKAFALEQEMVDDANRAAGVYVPGESSISSEQDKRERLQKFCSVYSIVPLPPGLDLVSVQNPDPHFDLAAARERVTAVISSAYGASPAMWEQNSNMKGNVELFEQVSISTVTTSVKLVMEAASKIFNAIHLGQTHVNAILGWYTHYTRPEIQKKLLEKLEAHEDHDDDRSGSSYLPFALRAAQKAPHIYMEEPVGDIGKHLGVVEEPKKKNKNKKRKREENDDTVRLAKIRKTMRDMYGNEQRLVTYKKDFGSDPSSRVVYGAEDGQDEDETPASTATQLLLFAEAQMMDREVRMFIESVPDKQEWIEDELERMKNVANEASYSLTIAPYASRQTNDEILQAYLSQFMTAEEAIQRVRNNMSLHAEDMSEKERAKAIATLEQLKNASAKGYIRDKLDESMQNAGVNKPSSAGASNSNGSSGGSSGTAKKKSETTKKDSSGKEKSADKQDKEKAEKKMAKKESGKSSDQKKTEKNNDDKNRKKKTAAEEGDSKKKKKQQKQ